MNKAVNAVQLSLAAGKAVYGSQLMPHLLGGKVKLVVCSEACGANTKKKLKDKSAFRNIPFVELPAAEFDAVSSKPAVAYGIEDAKLADRILNATGKER